MPDTRSVPGQAGSLPPVRFQVLDSWRGLAALAVVLFHSPIAGHLHDLRLVRAGEAFVDFFFVLSGFVIAHAYAGRIADGGQFGRFLLSRVGRLLPLHLFLLGLFVLFELAKAALPFLGNPADPAFSGANSPAALAGNLVFLQAFWPDELTWNTPAWSISAEFAAYLVFGAAVLLAGRRLPAVMGGAFVLSAVILIAFAPHGMVSTAGFGWARALFGFSAGVWLQGHFGAALLRAREEGSPGGATLREVAAVAVALGGAVSTYGTPLAYALPLLFGLVILVFALEAGAVSRLLRTAPFLLLGSLSFSIYLVHLFVQNRFVNLARLGDIVFGTHAVVQIGRDARYGSGIVLADRWAGDALTLLMLATVIAVSLLTFRFIERPGQARFRAWADVAFAGRRSERAGRNEKGRLEQAASRRA